MFVVKLIGKLFLIPVIVTLFLLNLTVAIIGGIYGVIHSFFWGLMMFAVILAACFGMWPQVIEFTVFMVMSMVIVAFIEVLTAFLGGAMGSVAAMLTA